MYSFQHGNRYHQGARGNVVGSSTDCMIRPALYMCKILKRRKIRIPNRKLGASKEADEHPTRCIFRHKAMRRNLILTDSTKTTRHLIPPYPAFDLPTAIEKAQLFYMAQRKNSVPKDTAIQSLVYAGSSHGRRALAATLAYGLLEEDPTSKSPQVRLSALALDLLRNEGNSALRTASFQESAMKPTIYRDMVSIDGWREAGRALSGGAARQREGHDRKYVCYDPGGDQDGVVGSYRERL